MSDTFDQVQTVIKKALGLEDGVTVTPETRFVEDLKADSMDQFFLFEDFCEKFGLSINDEDYSKIKTVGDAVNYIEERKTK